MCSYSVPFNQHSITVTFTLVLSSHYYRVFGKVFQSEFLLNISLLPFPFLFFLFVFFHDKNLMLEACHATFCLSVCHMRFLNLIFLLTEMKIMFVDPCIIVYNSYRKSNKMPQCIKILFHIYMKINMFRATHRPSSGAKNCTSSLWFCIRGRLLEV